MEIVSPESLKQEGTDFPSKIIGLNLHRSKNDNTSTGDGCKTDERWHFIEIKG